MQIKCLTNSFLTLCELKKWKPNLYKSDYCILCKEETLEDLEHLMKCTVLQDSWEEIEEAIIEGISKLQVVEANSPDLLLKIRAIIFPKDKESWYQKRKELIIRLEEKKMAYSIWLLAREKNIMRT